MPKPRQRGNFNVYQGAYLGLTLAASILLFGYLGYRLDAWLATSPWLLVVGCVLGLAGGMTHVIRRVGALSARTGAPEPPETDHERREERDERR